MWLQEGGEEAAAAAPSESDKGAGEGSVDEVGAVGGVGVTDNADIDLATEITVSDDTHTLSTVQVDQEQFDVENDSVAEVGRLTDAVWNSNILWLKKKGGGDADFHSRNYLIFIIF